MLVTSSPWRIVPAGTVGTVGTGTGTVLQFQFQYDPELGTVFQYQFQLKPETGLVFQFHFRHWMELGTASQFQNQVGTNPKLFSSSNLERLYIPEMILDIGTVGTIILSELLVLQKYR